MDIVSFPHKSESSDLLDAIRDQFIMSITDVKGIIIDVNETFCAISQYSRKELLGQNHRIINSGCHEPEFFAGMWKTIKSGNSWRGEICNRAKNGSIYWVDSVIVPLHNSAGKLDRYISIRSDITLKKLRQSESADLLGAVRDKFIMSITDRKGTIIDVNDTFCDISRYSRDELIGQNHRIINSGQHEPSFFKNMWKTIMSGRSWRGEICNRAKDGSIYWVDSVITPLHNSQGKINRFVSIRSDITKRKRQESDLIKSKILLDRTGQIAGVGGWEFDLSTQAIYWSKETCVLHGVEPGYKPSLEEAVSFYAPEAREAIQIAVKNGIEKGESWDLELPFIRANGEKIWVRAVGSAEISNGKVQRLIGAFQDITEQVRQRNAIERNHLRMSLATDSGKIGVWEYDLVTGSLIWDEWMYRLYGLSPLIKTETYELWAEHLHPDDKLLAEQALNAAIEGKSTFDTEFRIIWKDGSVHYIRGTGKVERDESHRPIKVTGINWDVTDIRQMTCQLEEQHELLQVTLDSIGDAVITTNAQGITQWLNPSAQRMTGWTKDEAKGRPLEHVFNIVNEDTRCKTENPVNTCIEQGKTVGLANHTLLISRTGEEFGIQDSAAPIKGKNGEILGVVLVFHDVTEQRRLSGEVSYRATHDALTSLINRSEFEARLNRLLTECNIDNSTHALLCIDLDQFKIINDTCGHAIGDEALIQVSKAFSEVIRSRDTLARLGGDEFGVILENCDAKQALRVAQKVCEKMESFRFVHGEHRFRIGASIGLVEIDNRWPTIATLMQAADQCCYAAKDAGRNRVHTYTDSDHAIRTRHGEMQWTTRIEHALDEGRFVLFTQQLVKLNQKENGIHAEVLVRMLDDEGSFISPGTFFPAAERFHLASRIDRWVLQEVTKWLDALPAINANKLSMLCVNLSGQSVGDRAFHEYVYNLLQKLHADLRCKLCIEITETAAITNITDAALFIEKAKSLGVSIALDDFGAGASSFGYLKSLDVDILKIDGQFIQDLLTDPLDEAAVRCFIDVANVVGLSTVAEFVDAENILQKVKALGIDYAQGFYLHKPDSIDLLFENDESLGCGSEKQLKLIHSS